MASMSELRARVARSVDRVAAEEVRLIPYLSGGGYVVGGLHPDIAPFTVRAIVSETSKRSRREGSGAEETANVTLRTVSFRISIALDELAGQPQPDKPWRVRLLDPSRASAPELAIASFEPPDAAHGRLILHLTRA